MIKAILKLNRPIGDLLGYVFSMNGALFGNVKDLFPFFGTPEERDIFWKKCLKVANERRLQEQLEREKYNSYFNSQ